MINLSTANKPLRFPILQVRPGLIAAAIAIAFGQSQPAHADDGDNGTHAFELGTVTILGNRLPSGEVGEDQVASQLSRKEMRLFNRDNVGDALNLLSGVTLSNNSRNEKTITVRGYDSRQVPLFIDGIPVYVPYDGYIDFNRFTTADLAGIQVAKGYSSVAYGPNTLGGAINLISRKPGSAFEADVSAGLAASNERQTSANIGSNQGMWYLQTGVSYIESDGFPLSGDFQSTPTQGGGQRNNAYRKDSKLSLKLGLTPVSGDEYALSYYSQHGEKGQPPSTVPSAARYWKWPYWDKESLYFVSQTALGSTETLKLRLYHDRYANEVDSYTDGTYSVLKTNGAGSVSSGRSIYNDYTNGASLELQSKRWQTHSLRLVAHYKADEHHELDGNATSTALFKDALSSLALEDNMQLRPDLTLSMGATRDELRPQSVFSLGNPYSLPVSKTANGLQAGLYYDSSDTARWYATFAKKSRLPTLKDRYSQRLGTFIENPTLQPEEAENFEIGYQGSPCNGCKADAAVFYSDVSNKIQAVANVSGVLSQMQNVGQVRISGLEFGLQNHISAWLDTGLNYTFTDMVNVSSPSVRLTDVPRHKITAQAILHPAARLDVVGFLEHDSSRWASNTLALSGFTTLNLKASYTPLPRLNIDAGINNLTDKNYFLADGFPNPGRSWFVNATYFF